MIDNLFLPVQQKKYQIPISKDNLIAVKIIPIRGLVKQILLKISKILSVEKKRGGQNGVLQDTSNFQTRIRFFFSCGYPN